ncbi:MAG: hypothetical protein QF460_02695 [Candidatus Nanoarchaeia archaeon]|jgi:hypothetical protein|nr:hypothetical protein [Candidatus Nanoarchaeia archaeon]|tara:strand:+ start:1919 stop:2257 length:339 start_codon:yes stop_codon:yes gene_type:complete
MEDIENFFRKYNTSIIEETISYDSGLLKCESNLYSFEISSECLKAYNKKQDCEEFRLSDQITILSKDPALIDTLTAIQRFLPEFEANSLSEIIGHSIYTVRNGQRRHELFKP